jgi:DNA-binding transcriptional ArsR family regulator
MGANGYLISSKDGKGIMRSLRKEIITEGRLLPTTIWIVGLAEKGHYRREARYTNLEKALERLAFGLPRGPKVETKFELGFPDREKLSREHRDAILSLAPAPFRKTAYKRAYMLKFQTGSFTVSPEHKPEGFFDFLSSREAFLEAVKASASLSSAARGNHKSKAEASTWEDFSPDSPKKASLSVEIPSDLPEDVEAEVRKMLLRQGAQDIGALPCHECNRRFNFEDFRKEAEERIVQPEQVEALRKLEAAFRAGELQEACPVLWYALGEAPPYREREDGSPYGNTIEEYRCGLHGLASKYAWKASFRILYERARSALFADSRQGKWGEEIEAWEARQAEEGASESPSPEEIIVEALCEEEVYAGLRARIKASTSRKPFADSLCKLLGFAREYGEMPSGAQAAKLGKVSESRAYHHISALYSLCWGFLEEAGIVEGEKEIKARQARKVEAA